MDGSVTSRAALRPGWILAGLLLAGIAVPAPGAAQSAPSANVPVEQARARDLYDHGRLEEAREAYLEALARRPGDYQILMELSRAESELGEDAAGEDRRRLGAAAIEHARRAAERKPDCAEAHLALAIALGRQAMHEGPRTRLALAREVKAEVDRCLELDPSNGLAYHVRGAWNRKVASLGFFERLAAHTVLGGLPQGASMENALRDFRRSVELEPTSVLHWLELGRTCLDLDRRTEARDALEKAIALPPVSGPRDSVYQREAQALLRKIHG